MPIGIPVSPNPPGSLMSATPVTDAIGGGITSVSVANPTVIGFAADHGLQSGASITIAGTNTTTTTVGTFVVTVVDSNHVTIPVAVTIVTTGTGTATAKTLQQQVGVPGTVAVTGTFWQTTQPVSGAVTVSDATQLPASLGQKAMAASLPVALASDQGSIPVAATVQGTVSVSGTFWQATQPVSGTVATTGADGSQTTIGTTSDASSALTLVGLLKAIKAAITGTITVSGTFWQATQPVSGTVTANAGSGTLATSLAVLPALVAGEAHVGALGGATVQASGSVTRPANTTAYAAGQVVGTASTDVVTISSAARKTGGSGVLLDLLLIDQGGATAAGAFEVYLFTASPTAQADQVAFALVSGDLSNLIAVVPVGSSYVTNVAATISGSRVYPVTGVNAGFVCAGGSTSLYAVIVTREAYGPLSTEVFSVVLQIAQD